MKMLLMTKRRLSDVQVVLWKGCRDIIGDLMRVIEKQEALYRYKGSTKVYLTYDRGSMIISVVLGDTLILRIILGKKEIDKIIHAVLNRNNKGKRHDSSR
jgi:predicted LPLAT superfamily acyltransferase